MVSSWPPRKCGIGTFAEEALEFIQKQQPERPTYVISHTDGQGNNVFPIIDISRKDWYVPVAAKIKELDPYAVHLQHEYGLYNYVDRNGVSDNNEGFLRLIEEISEYPTVVEPHTIHGRMREHEEEFVRRLAKACTVLLFKCHYQKWRLEWTFSSHDWEVPRNIMIIPHGARSDKKYAIDQVSGLKTELGLDALQNKHVVGLVGWIQRNKRWDIVTEMWGELHDIIKGTTGEEWVLLAAGEMRDPNDLQEYKKYVKQVELLQEKGLAHFYKFEPRGDIYYKVMAICDFIVLPSLDETQSGTLARVIALNKPYLTTAPLEGLTAQTLESGGGLLFTTKAMLKERIIRLATDEGLRWELGYKLYTYLTNVVSWEKVARQYYEAYEIANREKQDCVPVSLAKEF
jgi:glycosyltransferase involved in cell wall biosynthesis